MKALFLLGRTPETFRFFAEAAAVMDAFDARTGPVTVETAGAPDLIVSYSYRWLVPAEVLALPPLGAYNLHPSYLPWGRGAHPVFWAIRDGEPTGATIHRMTPALDRGPILSQSRVKVYAGDTLRTVHQRCHEELLRMWLGLWPYIQTWTERAQVGAGSEHRAAALPALLDGWDTPVEVVRSLREHAAVPIHDSRG